MDLADAQQAFEDDLRVRFDITNEEVDNNFVDVTDLSCDIANIIEAVLALNPEVRSTSVGNKFADILLDAFDGELTIPAMDLLRAEVHAQLGTAP